jgi:hypothetical protein
MSITLPAHYTISSGKVFPDKASMVDEIYQVLEDAGWTMVEDEKIAYGFKVYSSPGETGTIPQYIKIDTNTAGLVNFYAYYSWTLGAPGTGSGGVYNGAGGGLWASDGGTNTLYMYASMDLVVISTPLSGGFAMFGHFPDRLWTTMGTFVNAEDRGYYSGSGTGTLNTFTVSLTPWTVNEWSGATLTDALAATFVIASNTDHVLTVTGTPASGAFTISMDVDIEVTSVTGTFVIGNKYQILGANNEGRDRVTVTNVSAGVVTVGDMPRDYSAGSLIGECPSTFGVGVWDTDAWGVARFRTWYTTCAAGTAGLAASNHTCYFLSPFDTPAVSPDYAANGVVAWPITIFSDGNTDAIAGGVNGYCNTVPLFMGYQGGTLNLDTFAIGVVPFASGGSGTATDGGLTTLEDTSKSGTWTSNCFANYDVILTAGNGVGSVRKIVSNTTTELTVTPQWVALPVGANTNYQICSEAYRIFLPYGFPAGALLRDGV